MQQCTDVTRCREVLCSTNAGAQLDASGVQAHRLISVTCCTKQRGIAPRSVGFQYMSVNQTTGLGCNGIKLRPSGCASHNSTCYFVMSMHCCTMMSIKPCCYEQSRIYLSFLCNACARSQYPLPQGNAQVVLGVRQDLNHGSSTHRGCWVPGLAYGIRCVPQRRLMSVLRRRAAPAGAPNPWCRSLSQKQGPQMLSLQVGHVQRVQNS